MVRLHRGYPVGAEASFRESVTLRSCFTDAWWNRGLMYLSRGRHGAALDAYRAALRANPQAAAAWAIQARNLKKMSDAGVKITVGTDGNTPWAPHVEMADMVAAGMNPSQVIVAATRNGAEFLRMANTGTIAQGQIADLLVLDANPLEDITNTRKINAVYLRGVAVPRP